MDFNNSGDRTNTALLNSNDGTGHFYSAATDRSGRLPIAAPVRALMAQREDCAIPIVPMSSDRLFLGGLLASIARLRFTGTINLPCLFQRLTQTGHFYFASMRTFLLCLDTG